MNTHNSLKPTQTFNTVHILSLKVTTRVKCFGFLLTVKEKLKITRMIHSFTITFDRVYFYSVDMTVLI